MSDLIMPVKISTGNGNRYTNLFASEMNLSLIMPFLWMINPKIIMRKMGIMVSITAILF